MTEQPNSNIVEPIAPSEQYLISSVRNLDFGMVEVVVHEGQIVEVSQKRRRRFSCGSSSKTQKRD